MVSISRVKMKLVQLSRSRESMTPAVFRLESLISEEKKDPSVLHSGLKHKAFLPLPKIAVNFYRAVETAAAAEAAFFRVYVPVTFGLKLNRVQFGRSYSTARARAYVTKQRQFNVKLRDRATFRLRLSGVTDRTGFTNHREEVARTTASSPRLPRFSEFHAEPVRQHVRAR